MGRRKESGREKGKRREKGRGKVKGKGKGEKGGGWEGKGHERPWFAIYPPSRNKDLLERVFLIYFLSFYLF